MHHRRSEEYFGTECLLNLTLLSIMTELFLNFASSTHGADLFPNVFKPILETFSFGVQTSRSNFAPPSQKHTSIVHHYTPRLNPNSHDSIIQSFQPWTCSPRATFIVPFFVFPGVSGFFHHFSTTLSTLLDFYWYITQARLLLRQLLLARVCHSAIIQRSYLTSKCHFFQFSFHPLVNIFHQHIESCFPPHTDCQTNCLFQTGLVHQRGYLVLLELEQHFSHPSHYCPALGQRYQ